MSRVPGVPRTDCMLNYYFYRIARVEKYTLHRQRGAIDSGNESVERCVERNETIVVGGKAIR